MLRCLQTKSLRFRSILVNVLRSIHEFVHTLPAECASMWKINQDRPTAHFQDQRTYRISCQSCISVPVGGRMDDHFVQQLVHSSYSRLSANPLPNLLRSER